MQDILENDSINLDWMFRYSLINDVVKVRTLTQGTDARTNQSFRRIYESFLDVSVVVVSNVENYI